MVAFTVTSHGQLLKAGPDKLKGLPAPTAGDCYRFALSNPNIDICITGPANGEQMRLAGIKERLIKVEEVEDGDNITRVVFFEREEDAHNYAQREDVQVPPGGRVLGLTSEECQYILNLYLNQHQVWGVIFLANGDTLHLDFKSYMMLSTGPGGGYNTIEA